MKDLPSGSSWIPGIVLDKRGPRSYLIELQTGCVVHRHIDHIRSRTKTVNDESQESEDWTDSLIPTSEPVTPELPTTDPPP